MERRPCDTSKNCVSEAARPPPRHRSPHVHRRHSCWRPTSEGKAHVSDQEDDEDRRECGWRGRAGDRHRRGPAEQRSAVSPHSGRPRPADGHPVREHPHPAREPAARVGLGRRLGVDRRRWRFAHRLVHQGRHPVHDASGRTVCPGPACGLGLGRPRPADGHPVREHPHPAREPAARVGLGRRLGVDRRRWRFAHPVSSTKGATLCMTPPAAPSAPALPSGSSGLPSLPAPSLPALPNGVPPVPGSAGAGTSPTSGLPLPLPTSASGPTCVSTPSLPALPLPGGLASTTGGSSGGGGFSISGSSTSGLTICGQPPSAPSVP